ncbi:MAG TPA: hydroxymethylglutaryl-CoA synthase, partial [Gammaproteobacteria bacterium]|nr:hydroxymethylglutaryl-CoA synthase [Gammaproteobacteria bacterium]
LLVASDVARYGLNTSGESSQGCGAVAMLLSANPRIMAIDPEYGVVTESIMDFWRPNYRDEALVDGKYSSRMYLQALEKTWNQYRDKSKRDINDHAYFCYHTPVPRLAEKAHQYLTKLMGLHLDETLIREQMQHALRYNREVGNSYTASLYLGLASLLENAEEDLQQKRIGFYSYGSGCVAEFFSGVVQSSYSAVLDKAYHHKMLSSRSVLSYDEYEKFYNFAYPVDGGTLEIPHHKTGPFRLARIQDHKRIYESTSPR